jgi:hypothetical protein
MTPIYQLGARAKSGVTEGSGVPVRIAPGRARGCAFPQHVLPEPWSFARQITLPPCQLPGTNVKG